MSDEGHHAAQDEEIAAAWRDAGGQDADALPPAALDARILAAARAAVQPAPRRPRYAVPLALAASLVVAVGLALQQHGVPIPQPEPAVMGRADNAVDSAGKREAPVPARDVDGVGGAQAPAAASQPAPPAATGRHEAKAARQPGAEAEAASTPAAPTAATEADAPADAMATTPNVARARALDEAAGRSAQSAQALPAPSMEFEAIRAALARGDRDRAIALLTAFRERHPQFVLPADLAELTASGAATTPAMPAISR